MATSSKVASQDDSMITGVLSSDFIVIVRSRLCLGLHILW